MSPHSFNLGNSRRILSAIRLKTLGDEPKKNTFAAAALFQSLHHGKEVIGARDSRADLDAGESCHDGYAYAVSHDQAGVVQRRLECRIRLRRHQRVGICAREDYRWVASFDRSHRFGSGRGQRFAIDRDTEQNLLRRVHSSFPTRCFVKVGARPSVDFEQFRSNSGQPCTFPRKAREPSGASLQARAVAT